MSWPQLDGAGLLRLVKRHVPDGTIDLENPRSALPKLAKDRRTLSLLQAAIREVPTLHRLYLRDARDMDEIPSESVHLVLTSPPYWTLKDYRDTVGQLGHIRGYEQFLDELDKVWRHCFRVLVEGGRLVVVVGDVCLSRRKHDRHAVVPLHASIQERCRGLGFDNLAPIIWHKIANAAYEVQGGSGFLGKPYEPNAIIKNDIEYILMQRKPRAYRSPSVAARVLSVMSDADHKAWFRQIWDLPGASTQHHPAPFPLELAERLIRMFSFVGDTVLDPFMGTATTSLAASLWGRNSVGVEVDPMYFAQAEERLRAQHSGFFASARIEVVAEDKSADAPSPVAAARGQAVV